MNDGNEKQNTSQDELEIIEEELSDAAKQKIEKYKKELESCRKEKSEYLEGWQRAKADFINYKKDEEKRFEEFSRIASSGLISELLAVLDSFDMALQYDIPENVQRGVMMIRSQLEDILKRWGLSLIVAKRGDVFDSSIHESVAAVESDEPAGTIIEEVQRGYMLYGRVIRPSRVRLSKGKDK